MTFALIRMVAALTLTAEQINELRMLGVPDPVPNGIKSSQLTEGGGLVEVNVMGETSSTQVICLQTFGALPDL